MSDPESNTPPPGAEPVARTLLGGGSRSPKTMPPPEWTTPRDARSASSIALELRRVEAPVARKIGPRAEQAWLRARIEACREAGDITGERAASGALARALAARGAELDLATKLARRCLSLGDDRTLREELSGWYAGLGEPALAAATLRSLVAEAPVDEAARVLTRVAVLLARAGDARAASEALAEAARVNASDPVAPELLGALGAWSSNAVPAARAAEAYLEGSRRHEARGEKAAAFEDLLRAFEMAPEEPVVAEKLAAALAARGRPGAGDEVVRAHAQAMGDRGSAIHLRRVRDALAENDTGRALAAAFDAGMDADLDPRGMLDGLGREASEDGRGPSFDEVLSRAGLFELVAARLELAAEMRTGRDRSLLSMALGRLASGPLGSSERAVEAYIEAFVSDPSRDAAKGGLREHATVAHDPTPLVESLTRVGASADAPEAERKACLRELVVLGDQRLDDPGLALWAAKRLAESGDGDAELESLTSRLATRLHDQDAMLEASATGSEDDRVARLGRRATILRGRPDDADRYVATLSELVAVAPEARAWRAALVRALARDGKLDELAALWKREIAADRSAADVERARLGLAQVERARGEPEAAAAALEPLLGARGSHTSAACMTLVLAARSGDAVLRARALARVAAPLAAPTKAALLGVASEILLGAGDVEGARTMAEHACGADPTAARPVAALAATAVLRRDRAGAAALERALGVVVPRATWCEALASAQYELGEPALALAWAQRWLALRPGDPRAAATLLARVTEAGDATRIGDALAWLLSQPQPLGSLTEPLGHALRRLAELDPPRSAAIARRALDVFGPRVASLRNAVLTVAELVGERGLALAAVERWLAAGAPGGDRAELLLDVARRRKRAGDADGAARALARAMTDGANASDVLAELDGALPPKTSDGEIAILEARAEALSGASSADIRGTTVAWRELGAALWDLAGDHEGAVRAWERAAALDPERGVARLARDLVAFSDSDDALRRLTDLAERREDPRDGAQVLSVAAHVALGSGQFSEALEIACRALELDPTLSEVLAVAERAARPEDVDMLARAYEVIAKAALGIYGERAAHYRAARQFEKRGAVERALRHAVRAFEAVPGEGVTFILMLRLAQRVGSTSQVVEAIERVATSTESKDVRAAWLRRAAMVAGEGEEGRRQRVDVLLRALALRPNTDTLRALGSAMAALSASAPEEHEVLELRFTRMLDTLLPRADGPDGSRLAIEAAIVSLDVFDSPERAIEALERAMAADADVDEYARLDTPENTARLLAARDRAGQFVDRVVQVAENKFGNAGVALLTLGTRLADALGEASKSARLVVRAALRDPENGDLVQRADDVARELGDPALLALLVDAVPPRERLARWRSIADEASKTGDLPAAIDALEQARGAAGITNADRTSIFDDLASLYGRAGRRTALEEMLGHELERGDLDDARRMELTRLLAAHYSARGEVARGIDLLRDASDRFPKQRELHEDLIELARQVDDRPLRAASLGRLVDFADDALMRVPLLRELCPLLDELHDPSAVERWTELLRSAPNDTAALAALERNAEASGDHEIVVAMLARRATLSTLVEDVRRIRLRRAAVLEQRLGRPDEARNELEAVLAATGDHLGVLRVLADLNSRMSAPLRAAPLWFRASALAPSRDEAADLGIRSVDAYLSGGDVAAARRVLEGLETWTRSERVLALKVEIERRSGEPGALAEALEDLALASMGDPKDRAALLVEAARASDAMGDLEGALARAERAARIAPGAATAQLAAKLYEYRARGPGDDDRARLTIAELRSIAGALDQDERALAAFLIAEALDVAVGGDASLLELSRTHAETGPVPLVALGMAERIGLGDEPARALPLFEAALGGDLCGVRTRGAVALAAAHTARKAGDEDHALGFLERAAGEEGTRAEALSAIAALRARRVSSRSERPLGPVRESSVPGLRDPRAEPDAPSPTQDERTEPEEPLPLSRPKRGAAPEATEPHRPRTITERIPPPPEGEAIAPLRISSAPPPTDEIDLGVAAGEWSRSLRSLSPSPRGRKPGSMLFPPATANEGKLLDAIGHGSVEAGKELIQQLENRADRTHDLVVTCRGVAVLLPGDRWVLEKLYAAALADRDIPYARAVEHVLRAQSPTTPVEPPELGSQRGDPDRVRSLLFRDMHGYAAEALETVWHGAQHVFRRDAGTYGVTGLERVPIGGSTPVARLYAEAARLLGLTSTPLFQRRSAGAITLSVALLSPPSIILSGEAKSESPELAYHLGAMLAASLPSNCLMFGLPESQARSTFAALNAAFGPPAPSGGGVQSIATLAEVLWESVPARHQRRLRELCHHPDRVTYEAAMFAARQAARRSGLFVCGDLGVALRETFNEDGISTKSLDAPDGLAAVCAASPGVADLVNLATSPEYADARWHPERRRGNLL